MATNYILDPSTGLPVLQTPNGPGLPLPLSAQQMQQAGAQLAPPPGVDAVAPPPMPDQRLASNDFRVHLPDPNQIDLNALPSQPKIIPVGAPNPTLNQFRQRLDAPPAAPDPRTLQVGWGPTPEDKAAEKKAGPKLAEPTEDKAPERDIAPNGNADDAALLDKIGREARGGGGGSSKIGVLSEKRKFSMPGAVDPALAKDIGEKTAALDGSQAQAVEDHATGEHALLTRQALEQQQRLDDLAAERAKRAAVDTEIQHLQDVRTQREQEAAQLKAPQLSDYWKDKGAGAKISTAIAAICGGYLQGLHGGSNTGLDLLNQNIDRWMQAQKEEYERARGKISDANNAYKQALDIYGTPAQADADLRLRTYAVRDAMLLNTANQIGTDEAKKNAQMAIQQNQLGREQATAAAQQSAKTEVEQTLGRINTGGGTGGTLKGLKAQAEGAEAIAKIRGTSGEAGKDARTRQIRMSDGQVGWTNSASKADEVQKQLTIGDQIVKGMQKLKALAADGTLTDRQRRAQFKAISTDLAPIISQAKGQGAMAEGEVVRMTQMLGDPNAIFMDNGAAIGAAIAQQQARNDAVVRDNVYKDPQATQFFSRSNTGPSSAQDVP
jgi:hypothetical protein